MDTRGKGRTIELAFKGLRSYAEYEWIDELLTNSVVEIDIKREFL